MADYGLLAGLGEGLKEGIQSYQNERNYQLQKQMMQQNQQAGLLEKGMLKDPSGNISYTPEKQMQIKAERDSYDPASERSQRSRDFHRGLLSGINPELSKTIPDSMSAAELEGKGGHMDTLIKGSYGMQGRQLSNDRISQGLDIKRQNLSERQNVNASNAGQAFEKDPIMKQFKQTTNSLDRAQALLDGKTPITAKSFNVLQQDFINAMAPGGAATEGKVSREMIETNLGKLNELQQRFGSVQDLRAEQPQIVENLRQLIKDTKDEYSRGMSGQAADIHDSYANSSNPGVQQTIKEKLKRYAPNEHAKRYGGSEQGPAAPASAGPPPNMSFEEFKKWKSQNGG